MAAFHGTKAAPAGVWTPLNDATTAKFTVGNLNKQDVPVYIAATANATPPTVPASGAVPVGIPLDAGEWLTEMDPATLFPGIGAAARLYVFTRTASTVFLSNA